MTRNAPILRTWRVRRVALGALAIGIAVLNLAGGRLRAQDEADGTPLTITSLEQFWELSRTGGDREYPIKTRLVVNYYDPDWRVMWVGLGSGGTFIRPSAKLLPFQSGQVVSIDGFARPGKQEIIWDRTNIEVLENTISTKPVPLDGRVEDLHELDLVVVETVALVDRQSDIDDTHLRLRLINAERKLSATVRMSASEPIPQFEGALVRIRGVFSQTLDKIDKSLQQEIWVAKPSDISVESWLIDDPRFERAATEIGSLPLQRGDNLVRVEGTVHAQEPGVSVTIRDETGQARVLTFQSQALEPGTRVEAVGWPEARGGETALRGGLFRIKTETQPVTGSHARPTLRLTEQIRTLAPDESAADHPARITGVVTWSDPDTRAFFLQDGSGGVKVAIPPESTLSVPGTARTVVVAGTTMRGDFVPILVCRELSSLGETEFPNPRLATFEQANSGGEYGQWIELSGYVRAIAVEGRFARLELSTPGGEFSARAPIDGLPESLTGAVVKIRGVCDALVNDRRQMLGLRILVPTPEQIQVLEPVPADLFATAQRTIGSLRQFDNSHALNRRVQVTGVVVMHQPGEFLYLADGDDSLLVLARQDDLLQPGDRVDAVGFPGNRGSQAILREAVYRRTGSGPEPEPIKLGQPVRPLPELNGRLARATGTLLNVFSKGAEQWLQIQAADGIFEALGKGAVAPLDTGKVRVGSHLELTGVYRVQLDEHRQPRAVLLNLRSPRDVKVIRQPPWWTVTRALWLVAGIFSAGILAGVWGLVLARKNRSLNAAQSQLRRLNDNLEARVEERTKDLRQEVAERLRSERALREANQRFEIVTWATSDATWDRDLKTDALQWNEHFHRVFGFPADQFCPDGKTWESRLHPEDSHSTLEGLNQAMTGDAERWAGEYRFRRWDGTFAHIFHRCYIMRDENGVATRLIGAAQDFSDRKKAEAELAEAHRQLVEASRRAGMAEIASSVLHNVGNVLNSANVSCAVIAGKVRRSLIGNVSRTAALLQEHASDLSGFFTREPVGQKLPEFLQKLGARLTEEQASVLHELESLADNIEHIKYVVARQQGHARGGNVWQDIKIEELVEEALRMSGDALDRPHVAVMRDFHPVPRISTDKHKVLEILINLVRNAGKALADSNRPDKQMNIRIVMTDEGCIRVSVIDNGVGISTENLTRIFAHGFTTKSNGNGFGLHASALSARGLGGSLVVHSDGPGTGATFTLDLPAENPLARSAELQSRRPAARVEAM